jgi:protein TonB
VNAYGRRLMVCAVLSAMAHLAFGRGMSRLPGRPAQPRPSIVAVRIDAPPTPPPEPEKPVAAMAPAPRRPADLPRHHVQAEPAREVESKAPAPTERPATTIDPTGAPVFGVSMESTSQAGTGAAVPVGNTLRATPKGETPAGAPKALAAPVEPYEVTEMPLPKGRCMGRYNEEARQAAIEGTVVLDLVVDQEGHTRDIQIVQGLGHGLDQAALDALRSCRFSPGQRNGQAVPVRIRGFQIHFYLQQSD